MIKQTSECTIHSMHSAVPIQRNLPFLSNSSDQKPLRPIHYLGSKLRCVDFIRNVIDSLDPTGGYVCDLFAGSGTVSKFLSHTRPVISVDVQEHSRVLCSALLNPPSPEADQYDNFGDLCKNSQRLESLSWAVEPLVKYENDCINRAFESNPLPLCELLENGSIIRFEQGFQKECSSHLSQTLRTVVARLAKLSFMDGPEALITRYYGGLYFSYKQAFQLDVLLDSISKSSKEIRNVLLAATLSTASDIVNTVGKQFAQPIRPRKSDGTPKKNIAQRVYRDRRIDVFSTFNKWLKRYLMQPATEYAHRVFRMDYLDALDIIDDDVRVVYADPPYTRDHYSRFYHVLETISLRDDPGISTTFINGKTGLSRGLYRQNRHQSPFCIKSKVVSAFETMFKKVRALESSLVVSYSPFATDKKARPRLLTIEQLEELAKKYYAKVEVTSIGSFSHSKLNSSDKNFDVSYNAELVMVCESR